MYQCKDCRKFFDPNHNIIHCRRKGDGPMTVYLTDYRCIQCTDTYTGPERRGNYATQHNAMVKRKAEDEEFS